MKKLLSIISILAMLVTSCQKEKTEREGNFSISASREALQTGTKATVSDLGAFSWSAGDAIGLYNGTNFSQLTTTESGASVTFAGTVVGTPSNCAIFPYAIAKTPTSVTLPDTYQWKAGDVQAAMIAPYDPSGLVFKHLGGIIKVSLKNVPATATKFVLKANKDITGDFAIATVSGNNQISSSANTGKNSVAFTFAKGTATDMAFYVPVPVGNYVISSVSLQNAEGTTLWEFAGSTANEVTRAKLLIMPTLTIVSIPGSGENTGISVSIPANYSGTFYLPETTSDVVMNVEATANRVEVAYKDGAAAKPANVTIDCGSNTIPIFTITLPESHVELKGTAYTTLVSQTSLSTLVINNGTKVNTLNVQKGSVDVKGEVNAMAIESTVQNEAVVRISDEGKVTSSLTNDSQAEIQKSAAADANAIPTVTGNGKTDVVTTNKDAVNDIVKTLSEGGNVTLTENLDLYNPVEIYGTTNLALGGYSITAKHSDEFVFAVHNGATFNITGSGTIDGSNNVLAIKLTVKDDDPSKPAVLNITGAGESARCVLKGKYYAIAGNGSRNNTKLTLKYVDCYTTNTKAEDGGVAIYQPQVGEMNLSYTKCQGIESGVEIRSGSAIFGEGTELISTSETFGSQANGNGTTLKGVALAISQHSTNNPINVVVNGGTYTGIHALHEEDMQNDVNSGAIKVSIKGGIFNGSIFSQNNQGFVTGGTFNSEPDSRYVASGYGVKKNSDNTYTILECDAKLGDSFYLLENAFAAATEGSVITLIKDVTREEGLNFTKNVNATFDLNGHTLKVTNDTKCNHRALKISKGTLTVKNGTIDARNVDAEGNPVAFNKTKNENYQDGIYGTIRTDGGNAILERLTLYNNHCWGLSVKPASGSVTMNNCNLISEVGGGIEVAGGECTISNCTFSQTGISKYSDYISTAISVSGGAVANITNTNVTAEALTPLYIFNSGGRLNINGGTYEGRSGKVIQADAQASNTVESVVNITGGTFKGIISKTNTGKEIISITGGTFSDPSVIESLAEGYEFIINDNGTYTVAAAQ